MWWKCLLIFAYSTAGPALENKEQKIFSSAVDLSEEKGQLSSYTLKGWSFDYPSALKESQEKGKFLLLAFVGSKWCPWSKKLISEVLESDSFTKPLEKDTLFVCLDFPIISSLSSEQKALKELYGASEFPCLVLVHPSKEIVAKVGFLPIDNGAFAEYFGARIASYKELVSVAARDLSALGEEQLEGFYRKAQNITEPKYRQKLLEAGLKKKDSAFFLLEQYADLLKTHKLKNKEVQECRRKIVACDPSNHKKMHFQLAMLEFQVISTRSRKKDLAKAAIKPLVEYINAFGPSDAENLWKAEMTIAQYLFSKGKCDLALKHAKASYEAAPGSIKPEVALTVEFLNSYKP